MKGGGEYIYLPRIYGRGKVNLSELAERIGGECTAKRPDDFNVLVTITELTLKLLKENYSISLGDLSTFLLHASVTPADSESEGSEKNNTNLKVAFRPGISAQNELKSVNFTQRAKQQINLYSNFILLLFKSHYLLITSNIT